VVIQLHQPRARADIRVRVQICDVHPAISPQSHEGTKEKEIFSAAD